MTTFEKEIEEGTTRSLHLLWLSNDIKLGLSTNSSLAKTNFLRPTSEKNVAVLGWASISAVWRVIENILHGVSKQNLNCYGHERDMIKETKKVLHLLVIHHTGFFLILFGDLPAALHQAIQMMCAMFATCLGIVFLPE